MSGSGTVLCLGCVVLARALLSVRSSVDDLVVGSALFKEHTVRAVRVHQPPHRAAMIPKLLVNHFSQSSQQQAARRAAGAPTRRAMAPASARRRRALESAPFNCGAANGRRAAADAADAAAARRGLLR